MKYDWSKPAVVYAHRSPEGKFYIGVTTRVPFELRWGKSGEAYQYNARFWEDITRIGWDNFEHKILAHCDTAWEAFKIETELIHILGTTNPDKGYNNVTGSKYAGEISPDMRKRFSERSSDRVWVHAGTKEKSIKTSKLSSYLQAGWEIGRPPGYVVYVHKGDECRRATVDTVQSWLAAGWILGKTEKIQANIKKSRQQFVWCFDGQKFESAYSLADYMRSHGYPKIVSSTLTAAFNGQKFSRYPNLLEDVTRLPLESEVLVIEDQAD